MILDSFYKLTSASPKLEQIRSKKVAACKKMMGDKWLLAKPVERKENGIK